MQGNLFCISGELPKPVTAGRCPTPIARQQEEIPENQDGHVDACHDAAAHGNDLSPCLGSSIMRLHFPHPLCFRFFLQTSVLSQQTDHPDREPTGMEKLGKTGALPETTEAWQDTVPEYLRPRTATRSSRHHPESARWRQRRTGCCGYASHPRLPCRRT